MLLMVQFIANNHVSIVHDVFSKYNTKKQVFELYFYNSKEKNLLNFKKIK